MEMGNQEPVCFRLVLDLTSLFSMPILNCKRGSDQRGTGDRSVTITKTGAADGSIISSASAPGVGHVFGVCYPVAAVDASDPGGVWGVMAKPEAGESQDMNAAVAIGQALGLNRMPWPQSPEFPFRYQPARQWRFSKGRPVFRLNGGLKIRKNWILWRAFFDDNGPLVGAITTLFLPSRRCTLRRGL
jgi:hypothetical protein